MSILWKVPCMVVNKCNPGVMTNERGNYVTTLDAISSVLMEVTEGTCAHVAFPTSAAKGPSAKGSGTAPILFLGPLRCCVILTFAVWPC